MLLITCFFVSSCLGICHPGYCLGMDQMDLTGQPGHPRTLRCMSATGKSKHYLIIYQPNTQICNSILIPITHQSIKDGNAFGLSYLTVQLPSVLSLWNCYIGSKLLCNVIYSITCNSMFFFFYIFKINL